MCMAISPANAPEQIPSLSMDAARDSQKSRAMEGCGGGWSWLLEQGILITALCGPGRRWGQLVLLGLPASGNTWLGLSEAVDAGDAHFSAWPRPRLRVVAEQPAEPTRMLNASQEPSQSVPYEHSSLHLALRSDMSLHARREFTCMAYFQGTLL